MEYHIVVGMNELQRIARTDKKAFLSKQCKEIEEKKQIGNTRDLFKKIRDTKGTFHAKMGTSVGSLKKQEFQKKHLLLLY